MSDLPRSSEKSKEMKQVNTGSDRDWAWPDSDTAESKVCAQCESTFYTMFPLMRKLCVLCSDHRERVEK